jgi:hypothetical protein
VASKELNRGFHGFHGLEVVSDQTTLIRVIRAIRGKVFAKRSDPERLRCKKSHPPESRNRKSRKQKAGFPNFSFLNFSFSPKEPVLSPSPSDQSIHRMKNLTQRRKVANKPDARHSQPLRLRVESGILNPPLGGNSIRIPPPPDAAFAFPIFTIK